eukprot:12441187-Alexandrium_andersonii.AAC.1
MDRGAGAENLSGELFFSVTAVSPLFTPATFCEKPQTDAPATQARLAHWRSASLKVPDLLVTVQRALADEPWWQGH